jgi:hypothetical protein
MDGGFVAYADTSRLTPCRSYRHERDLFTNAAPLSCTSEIAGCPSRAVDAVERELRGAEFQAALQNHALFGGDPRPVDGQVFRISIGSDFVDVGPPCTGCPEIPPAIQALVDLLQGIDEVELAKEACSSVFGTP